jgi:murein DD-endopeptidase MepM/ murein hydrolase activator NlpD
MTTLPGLNAYQAEALIACLAASVIWAGVLLLGAMHLERRGAARGDKLWIAALLLAILPSLVAPSLAAFGVSLRPQSDAPVIVDTEDTARISAVASDEVMAAAPPVSATDVSDVAGTASLMTFDQSMDALALLYIYGAALALFIWLARQAGFALAAGLSEPIRNQKMLTAADDWAFDFGVKAPALKRSRHVSSVCIYGAVSPIILIPHDLDARVAEDDIALMCAHEIAHLKRGDTRLFTATALARVLFWFNPLVTRIAAQVELAAEEGADRLVIGSGVDRRVYASCFVKGLKYAAMKQSLLPALAPGFTPQDRQGRRRRLDSILSAENSRRTSAASRIALASAASIAALLAVGQAAFAVDPEAAAEKKRLAALASVEKTNSESRSSGEESFVKPVDGDVTLRFGETYTSLEDSKTPMGHRGVDIKAAKGAPVKASGDGVVVEATTRLPGKENYGTTVVIDHGHGMVSRYAHLDSYKVSIGQEVKKGEVIGAVGETGLVTGPHLHFEVLKNGKPIEPAFARAPAAPEPPEAPMWSDAALPVDPVEPILPAEPVEPIEPVEPMEPVEPEELEFAFAFEGDDGFAFVNGDTLTDRMAADLEHRLLGDLEVADGAVYDIEFRIDGKSHRFTSGEPMTPEKRSALKAAIEEMRVHRDKAREQMSRAQKEWRKDAEKLRADAVKQAEHMKRDFANSFANEKSFVFRWEDDKEAASRDFEEATREGEEARRDAIEAEREAREADREARLAAIEADREAREAAREAEREARLGALEAEREALETEIDALSDARADLDDAVNDSLDDALESLDEEEAAIDDEEMSDEDRRIAREAIADARRSVELSRRDHEREIERARRELERREAEIQRQLERLDQQMSEAN